ncbi:MAG: alpha/beta hydrolase [Pseudomarimonas sp.]
MSEAYDGIETQTGPTPTASIIWLHGLGADGGDFAPIVPQLVKPNWPALRFVFPHAPVRPVTINGGMRMRAWYDILGMEIAQRQDERGVRESVAFVDKLIEREATRGIPAHRVFLVGFSQGGAIALAAGVRHRDRLAGIVALSTYLPLAERTVEEASKANAGLPIFMGHGSLDPVVGHALGLMSAERLRKLGYPVDWYSYPMQHSVNMDEINELSRWMGARLLADSTLASPPK